jgi:poly-gamma-glutamate synthesis protein (capsule biosynthesis protein)
MSETRILFAGDFCIRDTAVDVLSGNILDEFSNEIKKVTSKCDISVVNVETVFTDNPTPTKKSGPNIFTPIDGLEVLKRCGFTIGAMANNHTCDQGEYQGLLSKKMIEDAGMLTMGYGKNISEAKKAIRVSKNKISFSFLNFAENEFSAATANSSGFAPIDYYENIQSVMEEKKKSDFVFVYLHAGNEKCPFPRMGLKKLSHALIENGADAIIISHPHCPQGIEIYMNKPIAYSMGNFFMSSETNSFTPWSYGYMFMIEITEDKSIKFNPIPYKFDYRCRWFSFLQGNKKEMFMEYLNGLSNLITDNSEEKYQRLCYAWSVIFIKDYSNFINEAKNDKSFDGEYMLFLKNVMSCESHNEAMTNYLKLLTTNRLKEFDHEIKMINELQNINI